MAKYGLYGIYPKYRRDVWAAKLPRPEAIFFSVIRSNPSIIGLQSTSMTDVPNGEGVMTNSGISRLEIPSAERRVGEVKCAFSSIRRTL